jgi:hypothetical protein
LVGHVSDKKNRRSIVAKNYKKTSISTGTSTSTLFKIASLLVYTRHPHALIFLGRHRHFLYRAEDIGIAKI